MSFNAVLLTALAMSGAVAGLLSSRPCVDPRRNAADTEQVWLHLRPNPRNLSCSKQQGGLEDFALANPARTVDDLTELLRRVAAEDRRAFQALFQATSAKLYGVVLRIARRKDLADDILQEAYLRIWRRAATFDPSIGSPIAWMAIIARNLALDEVRRRQPA